MRSIPGVDGADETAYRPDDLDGEAGVVGDAARDFKVRQEVAEDVGSGHGDAPGEGGGEEVVEVLTSLHHNSFCRG